MLNLPMEHPEIWDNVCTVGNFANTFGRIPVDKALKETAYKDT